MLSHLLGWLISLSALPNFEKVFWFFALVGTAIFLLQAILVLIVGADHSVHAGGHDTHGMHDHEGGLNLFTIRNMVVFFMMFGWLGIAGVHGHPLTALRMTVVTTIAFFGGAVMMLLVALMFLTMQRLTSDGNFDLQTAVGGPGKVYISFDEVTTGKIMLTVNNRTVEVKAESKVVGKGLQYAVGDCVIVEAVRGDTCLVRKCEKQC